MTTEKVDEFKSLVKYGKPVLFQSTSKFRQPGKKNGAQVVTQEEENNTEDILNSILPPREYTKDKKQLYVETVLTTPATRFDIL